MKFRTTMLSVLGSALAVAMTLAAAPIASAADMIGNCELTGEKGSIPLTPAKAGQLTVEVSLPAPGWWNGDTPESIADGYEYCMAANIAHRAGFDKVEVVNVGVGRAGRRPDQGLRLRAVARSPSPRSARRWSISRCPTSPPTSASW